MDITYENKMHGEVKTAELNKLVESILQSTNNSGGAVEDAAEVAANCAKMLGRLIDQLAHAGVLDDNDINEIVQHYSIGRIWKC